MNERHVNAIIVAIGICLAVALTCATLLFTGGCVERQELREQHCALRAIERHSAHRPDGAYGTWTRGTRCNARLWNGRRVDEGALSDAWRPE